MTLCSEVTEHLKMYPIAFPFPLIRVDNSSLVLNASPLNGKTGDVGDDGLDEDEEDDDFAVIGEMEGDCAMS